MLSHEDMSHEHFEELSALAAIGELSEEELGELRAHISLCAPCRTACADYGDLVHNKLPLLAPDRKASRIFGMLLSQNNGYKKRFFAEARKRGFSFREQAKSPDSLRDRLSALLPARLSLPPVVYYSVVTVVLLTAVIAGFYYEWRQSNLRQLAAAARVAELSSRNEDLRRQLDDRSAGVAEPARLARPAESQAANNPATARTSDSEKSALEAELSRARAENATLLARSKSLEEELQSASLQVQALRTEVETGKTTGNELAVRLREAERNLGAMSGELQSIRSGRQQDASTIAAQEARMKEMSDKLRAQAEVLDRERTLLTADRDIRDIMSARNLHVIDVYDVDGNGKDKKIFGRAFYTEGKSLVFYASDLDKKRAAKANHTFQAWGYRGATDRPAMSLGIFYVDDQKQNRWVLKFDDPEVLAQIDAVFVTIEPPGGSKKPTGDKLLYAYLRNKPNHP